MSTVVEAAAAEIEAYVGQTGWDRGPSLFALVAADRFSQDEPEAAARLGVDGSGGDTLTPIEQESLPDGELDEALAQIGWPESVAGCALAQEILILPPSANVDLDGEAALSRVAGHPERREARLIVAVLRDGSSAAMLRLRATDGAAEDDLLTGADLAPNLTNALLATLHED